MKIKMNGRTVDIFAGALVMDALRKYSKITWKQVQNNKKIVLDGCGHEVALDGELEDGEELFVKRTAAAKAHR
jgi:hypothetical protein